MFSTKIWNMKKLIRNILIAAVGLLAFSACNVNSPTVFTQDNAYVAFTQTTATVSEVNKVIEIPVIVTAVDGSAAITVNYDFSTEGLDNPAVEGTDFKLLNDAKTLSFPNGWGYDTIRIETIDNNVFTGDKSINIVLGTNSLQYSNGNADVLTLKISDDDHPLGWMFGTYTASGNLWRDAGAKTWQMVIGPDPDNISKIIIQGLISAGSYGHPLSSEYIVYGTVNMTDKTIEVRTGQEMPTWGYGPVTLVGWYGPDGAVDIATGDPVRMTYEISGGKVVIHVLDEYGLYITDGNNAGLYLELVVGDGSAVNTTWTQN